MEQLSRTRLIALAALNGAASSDALFASNFDFSRQITIIIPPLLQNIYDGTMQELNLETAKIEMDASPSPFFSEFSARRPVNDRRAPSLHAHIPGEKGPTGSDVMSAALRSLHSLLGQCQVNQASHVLDAVFAFLDKQGWMDVERCCWLAERLTTFTTPQYRFVVLTRLAESLADLEDIPPLHKHTSLLAMITTILNSNISLIGLGVTDILNNLVILIIRRTRLNSLDPLLPPLVKSVSSLATHIYYTDQINDIVEEITLRMIDISPTDTNRPEILRVLIYCIIGLMNTASTADTVNARSSLQQQQQITSVDKGKRALLHTASETPRRDSGRRNFISLTIWQETLPLLCEATYPIRAAYSQALLLFLKNEMVKERQSPQTADIHLIRFCNALHSGLYTLAMSSCLGTAGSEPSSTSIRGSADVMSAERQRSPSKVNNEASSEPKTGDKGVSFIIDDSGTTVTPTASAGGSTPPRKNSKTPRRASLPLTRLVSSTVLASYENVATPHDLAAILEILNTLHEMVPIAALVTAVPMLLALDHDAGLELVRRPGDERAGSWILERKRLIREILGHTWLQIGERWSTVNIVRIANTVCPFCIGHH